MARIVYVVDDEPVIAMTLAEILKRGGFQATAFVDPLEALQAAEDRAPDMLLSDVVMPQLNGVDLGIQFRSIHPKCKVLLFSGQAATGNFLEKAKSEGHDFEILVKPVHPKDLLATIEQLMKGE